MTLNIISNNTAKLNGIPTQNDIGDNLVTLEINDLSGGIATQEFVIKVFNINDIPIFTSTPISDATEDQEYEYIIKVSDPDLSGNLDLSENIVITAITIPDFLTLKDNRDNTARLFGTPRQNDVGENLVEIFAEDSSGATTTQQFTINVVNAEDEATGTLSFTGIVQEGATLTANTDSINDDDGSLTFTFQWQLADDSSSFDSNSNISGAIESTFTIPSDQTYIDKFIRLTAVSLDSRGGTTSFESSPQLIANVDDVATGTLSFTGDVQEGGILTANTNSIIDIDDTNTPLIFTFQWQLGDDSSSFSNIDNNDGGNNKEFIIPSDQSYVDKFIRVTAVSLDSRGGTTSFESSPQLIINVDDVATGILSFTGEVKEGATLTADTSDIKDVDTNNEPLTFTFQWQLADDSSSFDSNSNITGAISNEFTIPSDQSYVDKYIRLTANSNDDRGGTTSFISSSKLIQNVEDEATGILSFTGEAKEGATLTADTSDIKDVDTNNEPLTFTFQWQLGDDSSSFNDIDSNITGAIESTFTIPSDQSYVDKYIRLTAISNDDRGGTTSFISSSKLIQNVEDEATGVLSFTGEAKEGATLTADTSDIKDVDTNNEPLTFTFQWQLGDDSSSFDDIDSNITGAIESTFTIPSDQSYVDKYIRLTANSNDDRGGTTSFISSSKLIQNVEDEATGILSFTGEAKEGATLTADTSDIKDVDTNNEPLTFTFQWQLADDSSSFDDK